MKKIIYLNIILFRALKSKYTRQEERACKENGIISIRHTDSGHFGLPHFAAVSAKRI